MNAEIIRENDQILGYTLQRKIGSGGYGDVWEAEAPGGLKKAIKIIHGFHDEKRAQAEWKALNRIKDARHPFLLSLERIETFNSKLIVISELADRSLADLASDYRRNQETGIPREELIGYLRDSADALDYLNATFGLQHLDIKPENLLLVSGHAKVADFGLVKDLQEASQSLMSGMTPAYAAPELFDGRPGPASDQYSLATVYQEMLTSCRPFPGTTPAQLAAQHMHGKPDLRSLPISDQAIVARALSRDPADRFPTCSRFIAQLADRKTRKKMVKTRASVRHPIDTSCNTERCEVSPNSDSSTDRILENRLTFKSVELESLQPPACNPAEAVFQPTIVIGIGRSCSAVIQAVKQRLVARHGSLDVLPSLGLLCIDSDEAALAALSHDSEDAAMKLSETLAIPLRRSEQYRQHKKLDLSWISRRWIYNIPRSLQTEGLRPLGRLAFADHYSAICQKISDTIGCVAKTEHLAQTCDTLDLNPPDRAQVRVILVSNISGGIGSGMTNELAFTIRLLLAENGISDSQLIGMLMYSNHRGRERSLSTANAYAYMCELRHFAEAGYPGDRRLGIPEFGDELPFDFTYGLKMADDSTTCGSTCLDRIAEYICLSSTTRCQAFFDACREPERQDDEFTLRSFGISACGPGLPAQAQPAVESLSRDLIRYWSSGTQAEDFCPREFADACFNEFALTFEDATARATEIISHLDGWQEAADAIKQATRRLTPPASNFELVTDYFDQILDVTHAHRETSRDGTRLCMSAESEIAGQAQLVGDGLSRRILELVGGARVNLPGARQAVQACVEKVVHDLDRVTSELHSLHRAMQQIRETFPQWPSRSIDPGRTHAQWIQRYAQLRWLDFRNRCCHDYYRVIRSCLTSTDEMLKKLTMQLELVERAFVVSDQAPATTPAEGTIQRLLADSLTTHRATHLRQLETLVVETIEHRGARFLDLLSDAMNWQESLPQIVRRSAQAVLSNAFANIAFDEVISSNQVQPSELKRWLNQQLNAAMPSVTDCGGGSRLLLAQPRHGGGMILPETISNEFGLQPCPINGTTGDVVFCFEVEGILLANFAFRVLIEAPEATEIAKRIHSRDDVDWTTLSDLM